jgi:hypothetical protein
LFVSDPPTGTGVAVGIGAGVWAKKDHRRNRVQSKNIYTMLVVVFIVTVVYMTNSVRFYTREASVPFIGTNDDNMNHLAYTIMSIKEENLLFHSPAIQRMVERKMYSDATGWYPFGMYTHISYIYRTITSTLGKTDFDATLAFNVQAVYMMAQSLLMLVGIYALAERLYKAKTLVSLPATVTFGILVVTGLFFIKLFLYGFQSQMMGTIGLIALCLFTHDLYRKKQIGWADSLVYLMGVYVVGVTYYFFIPVMACCAVMLIIKYRNKQSLFPLVGIALSAVPLAQFILRQAATTQLSAYGIAFVSIHGFLICCIGVVLVYVLRLQVDEDMREILVVQAGLTLAQMCVVLLLTFEKTQIVSYYVYKSYWTLGVFCLPLCIAFLWYLGDQFATTKTQSVITSVCMLMFSAIPLYAVFAQKTYDPKGYDLLLPMGTGHYNYFKPGQQKKWIDVYQNTKETAGSRIYPTGMWGWVALSNALYGDIPQLYAIQFQAGRVSWGGHSLAPYATGLIEYIQAGGKPILLDGLRHLESALEPSAKTIITDEVLTRVR